MKDELEYRVKSKIKMFLWMFQAVWIPMQEREQTLIFLVEHSSTSALLIETSLEEIEPVVSQN